MIRRVDDRALDLRAAAAPVRGRHAADRRRCSAWVPPPPGWRRWTGRRWGGRRSTLTGRLLDGLASLPGVRVQGPPGTQARLGVVSFTVDGVHPHDVCQMLDEVGVCLRGGHHCAQPLMDALDLPATARASLAPYNDAADVDALLVGAGAGDPAAARGWPMSGGLYNEAILAEAKAATPVAGWRPRACPSRATTRCAATGCGRPRFGGGADCGFAHRTRGCLLTQAAASVVGRHAGRCHRGGGPGGGGRAAPAAGRRGRGAGLARARDVRAGRRGQEPARVRAVAVRGARRGAGAGRPDLGRVGLPLGPRLGERRSFRQAASTRRMIGNGRRSQ